MHNLTGLNVADKSALRGYFYFCGGQSICVASKAHHHFLTLIEPDDGYVAALRLETDSYGKASAHCI